MHTQFKLKFSMQHIGRNRQETWSNKSQAGVTGSNTSDWRNGQVRSKGRVLARFLATRGGRALLGKEALFFEKGVVLL